MMVKVAIIGTVGLPANYGGFETLVEYVTKDINQNFDITVYCSAKAYLEKLKTHNNCNLHYFNIEANGVQSIFYDIRAIIHALLHSDVLLILGVSGCILLPIIRLFSRKKIIVNIDGLEWKRQKWNRIAKWFLKLSERLAVNAADVVIGDNKVIQDYVWKTYGKKANLIAYGGDHCCVREVSQETIIKYPFLHDKYALKVCRIEPENNIVMILRAFSTSCEIPLVLIGNWSNSDFGRRIKSEFEHFPSINLIDPIYDQDVLNEIRGNCEFYIHGHSAGGTNPSLVEAMSLGLPCLCYDINYNVETTEGSALYFKSSDELKRLIKSVGKEELKHVGSIMKSIAEKRYRWSIISKDYRELLQIHSMKNSY